MEYQHYYVNDELHKHIWTQIHIVRTHAWMSVHRKFGRRQRTIGAAVKSYFKHSCCFVDSTTVNRK